MNSKMFDKEKFIQEIKDNVKNLYRKTLEEASQQEVYQAVSQACVLYVNGSPGRPRVRQQPD